MESIKYPIIVKTLTGSLGANSHLMSVCFNAQSLLNCLNRERYKDTTLIFQQCINHGQKVNKVYVVGEYIVNQVRQSLPDIDIQ